MPRVKENNLFPDVARVTTASQQNGRINKVEVSDKPIHDWYRFVLSFPPHLVRDYLSILGAQKASTVLDPFCGTGTTVLESKLAGFRAIGIEANPFLCFAARTKLDWSIDPKGLLKNSDLIAKKALREIRETGFDDGIPLSSFDDGAGLKTLEPSQTKLLITDCISALPLHKVLILLGTIEREAEDRLESHQKLALAKSLVFSISNLRFGPEVGVGKIRTDVSVVDAWLKEIRSMSSDIEGLQGHRYRSATIIEGDSRLVSRHLHENSVDVVITSPPYPNEKDYTRTTRLESVILGYFSEMSELREMKKGLIRSNTRGAYKEDVDDAWVTTNSRIDELADRIEKRRIELKKTSGFEKLYARVTKLYFGGMTRHFAELRSVLRPGAKLAYVVGDQASYLRVMIRTGEILAEIASGLGYELDGIDLFRTRAATATRSTLREEVVRLTWPG
jgi:DNA modification methylase